MFWRNGSEIWGGPWFIFVFTMLFVQGWEETEWLLWTVRHIDLSDLCLSPSRFLSLTVYLSLSVFLSLSRSSYPSHSPSLTQTTRRFIRRSNASDVNQKSPLTAWPSPSEEPGIFNKTSEGERLKQMETWSWAGREREVCVLYLRSGGTIHLSAYIGGHQ